jgi:hypothetical protein
MVMDASFGSMKWGGRELGGGHGRGQRATTNMEISGRQMEAADGRTEWQVDHTIVELQLRLRM